ncbi:hypothetical protein EXS73_02460 [Candidatus Pacearchaeota archaeon]|nr:hypothetical protein [Candidatus Pacearchaeota archaeon]
MFKWVQGNELSPQGRAIVYGVAFSKDLRLLADRSYFEHPRLEALASRQIWGVFHTLQSHEGVQKLDVPAELIREGMAQVTPQMHAVAEEEGIRTISYLPSFTFQLSSSAESLLPLTPHEDVIFVGSYHNSLRLHEAVYAVSHLYQARLSEFFERSGSLDSFVKKIPHTFSLTSVRDLPEETPLLPYLVNRFLDPLTLARAKKDTAGLMVLREELEGFGAGTFLETSLCELASAFVQPACRSQHVQEYQATHCSLVQYVATEEYAKAAEARQLIDAMKIKFVD